MFILDRNMRVIKSVSTDMDNGFWIDDTGSNGQKITLSSGCVVGSYNFSIDAYLKDSVYFQPGNFILFKDKYDKTRLYTIISVSGDNELTVESEDCGLDLLNRLVGAWVNKDHALKLTDAMDSALSNSGWSYQLHNDNKSVRDMTIDARIAKFSSTETVLKRLQRICATYNVEMEFESIFDGTKVTKQIVHVKDSITDNKQTVRRYMNDIDMAAISSSKTIKSLYTAILPVNGEITVEDIVYDDGDYFTKKGDPHIYARTANKIWSRLRPINLQATKTDGYIYYQMSGSGDNPQALFEEGLSNLKENSHVQFSYQTKVVDMDSKLGDYIQLVDSDRADPVYLTARITEVINHYTNPYEDECTISNYALLTPNVDRSIQAVVNEVKKVIPVKIKADAIDYAISNSPNEQPTDDSWVDINHLPTIGDGQYKWTRRTEFYSDGSEVKSYSVDKAPKTVIPKIVRTEYAYQLSQNGSAVPDGEWVNARPDATTEKSFVWTRISDTYDDAASTKITRYLVTKDGQSGKNGRSIVKQTHQYYLSTSNTSIEGGEWLDDIIPVLKVSTYIWKRLYTKYDDNTEVVGDPELDDFHNNQYNTIINLENKVISNNTLYEQQLSKIEKLEKVADEYKDISTKVNTITHTYENSINTFTNELNGVKKITGKITSSEDGIKIEKPDDPSGLANQLGSRGFEVTKPSATGNARTTVLKADEYGVYASSFKAVDSMSFGAHRAELYIVNEVDGELNVDGTGYFWIGDVI